MSFYKDLWKLCWMVLEISEKGNIAVEQVRQCQAKSRLLSEIKMNS